MAVRPPESTMTSLRRRLAARARERRPQLAGITIRYHGEFAYEECATRRADDDRCTFGRSPDEAVTGDDEHLRTIVAEAAAFGLLAAASPAGHTNCARVGRVFI